MVEPALTLTATRRRADGGPSARALLMSVLGQYVVPRQDDGVWTAALVGALGALGVEERAARQAVNRTAADGWLTGTSVGRYTRWRVSPAGTRLLATAWSRLERSLVGPDDWDGRWLVLVVPPAAGDRPGRERLAARLGFEGFGQLSPGVWISADGRAHRGAAEALGEVGLAEDGLVFVADAVGPDGIGGPDVAQRAWDLDRAAQAHERFLAAFADAAPADAREAFRLRTLLAHEWRQLLAVDPSLPAGLLPVGWAGERAREVFMTQYERWGADAESYYTGLTTLAVE